MVSIMSEADHAERLHGNTSRGRLFHLTEVGGSFDVKPEDYAKANCARAHYQNSQFRRFKRSVKFTSRQIRDEHDNVVAYRFTREH
jgi:hypothetical protein